MTTHDKDKIIALRNEADKFATKKLLCEGEYHPDFHTVSDERFYTLAFEDGCQAEREECAVVCERLISGDGICADNEVWIHDCAEAIRARGEGK